VLDGEVTRRMFVGSLAGVCLAGESLVLEAIAAERMPHRIVVRGVERAPFFELRDYGTAEVAGILNRQGILAVSSENGRYLFAFESLAARERAWREIRMDGISPREIAVYRSL
jgi:hypothetical protein